MLWAKIRVLVEVSLWLAGAFNLAGLFVGFGSAGNWRFPIVHLFSTALEALFCTGCVVLVYQLCLRWFGRERLEGLMTAAQVLVSVAAVLSGQILPRFVFRLDHVLNVGESSWWIGLLPPAWFAGLDDALAGSAAWLPGCWRRWRWRPPPWCCGSPSANWRRITRAACRRSTKPFPRASKADGRRRWLDRLVNVPPLSWWLRDPVARASFLLTAAYLVRDRDVKLRVYPGLAPMLIIPFVFLLREPPPRLPDDRVSACPSAGVYLGMVPLLGLQMLQYSQQWQAADIFRAAPMPGPPSSATARGGRCCACSPCRCCCWWG